MTWVVLVVDLVPDPAWRCVNIREDGEWGWHSPGVGVAEWGTVVAEQRGGVVVVVGKEQPTMGCVEPIWPHAFSHVNFKRHLSHRLESSPGELNKIQNSIGGDSVHIIQCQLVSVGVRWTSVGLSAVVRFFLVDFDCWFGNIPADSPAGDRPESPSDS